MKDLREKCEKLLIKADRRMSYPSGNHFGGFGVGNPGKSWWITRLFIRILWRLRGSKVPVSFGGEK